MRKLFGIVISLIFINIVFGQNLPKGQKRWDAKLKLTIDDFKIEVGSDNNEVIYSQFLISHSVSGFDFMKRNLNQRIENIFLGDASWIDTLRVENIQKEIEFQQMQFDISEIQARKFRKQLLENRNQIIKGYDFINKLNNDIIAEFSKFRLELIRETEGGKNDKKLEEWRQKIANQLKELEEFSFENKKKIRLD